MKSFGELLRSYRESKNLLLRQVAAALEMDTALLSKFERNERKPNKEQVIQFAKFYVTNPDELLIAWLSDKLLNEIAEEQLGEEALKATGSKLKNLNRKTNKNKKK